MASDIFDDMDEYLRRRENSKPKGLQAWFKEKKLEVDNAIRHLKTAFRTFFSIGDASELDIDEKGVTVVDCITPARRVKEVCSRKLKGLFKKTENTQPQDVDPDKIAQDIRKNRI